MKTDGVPHPDPGARAGSPLDRLGLPPALAWGYVGLLLFMVGDGVESNYLSPFLQADEGMTTAQAAAVITWYGLAAAIASFLAAALSDLWGPRRVMMLGAGVWGVFEVLFLAVGLTTGSHPLITVFYGLRGFGYPFFAYGFLVWISVVAKANRLATSIGWFYVAFTSGLPTLGALVADLCIPVLGKYNTLWLSAVVVMVGAGVALLGVREPVGRRPLVADADQVAQTITYGLKLLVRDRRVLMVALTRMINSIPTYAMAVFFPTLVVERFGLTLSHWLLLTATIYAVNIPFNVFFGWLGDRLGWRTTVRWCGAALCAVSVMGIFYAPELTGSYPLMVACGVVFGIALAGFVPLSAIAVSLVPGHKGAAMSAYNVGMGSAVFVGPLLVTLLYGVIGPVGLVWLFGALYVVAAFMTSFLVATPDEVAAAARLDADAVAPAGAGTAAPA